VNGDEKVEVKLGKGFLETEAESPDGRGVDVEVVEEGKTPSLVPGDAN
jgi:hypothetical protein